MSRSSGHCKGRVLYIDDDEALIFLTKRALERRDFWVAGYSSAAEALVYFTEHAQDFDVVVTDISMTGMSGAEVSQRIRHIRPDMPIIMATGCVRSEDHQIAQRLQINQLVEKPATMDEFVELLSTEMSKLDPEKRSHL